MSVVGMVLHEPATGSPIRQLGLDGGAWPVGRMSRVATPLEGVGSAPLRRRDLELLADR